MQSHGRYFATVLRLAAFAAAATLASCESGFDRIDRHVDTLLVDTSEDIGGNSVPPPPGSWPTPLPARPSGDARRALIDKSPPTVNPTADELTFQTLDESRKVLDRLQAYNEVPADALQMDLPASLSYATLHAREFKFEQENYILAALSL